MAENTGGTYQMLWDCPYCGQTKLLGLTHRHCPACGAAQDPSKRYFPAEEDKVAVEGHVFVGADRRCPACDTPNAAAAAFCGNCGGPMEGAGEVQRQADHVAGAGPAQPAPARPTPPPPAATAPKKKRGCLLVGGILVLLGVIVAGVLVVVLWKKPAAVTVSSHSWERAIDVEVFKTVDQSDWCDQMPSDAAHVRRSEKERSKKKVEVGQDCKTRQVDNGDGTFKEVQDCSPVYREDPVYDDWCDYQVDRWTVDRTEKKSGSAREPAPAWPSVKLKKKGECKGCEREGARRETYTVVFTDDSTGKTHECDFDQTRWAATEPGTRYSGKVGVVTKALDCGSLTGL